MTTTFSNILRAVSEGLNIPVIIILILLMFVTLFILGTLIVEIFTERRHLKVKLPELVDALKDSGHDLEETINSSGLLNRQKAALTELVHHPELNDVMRESLALELLEEEKSRFSRIVKATDLIAKLGPIFGLLGTLIPLGPGIVALGQGDTLTLSQSLLTAFDTTVAGLISAAVAMVISVIRKGWYKQYMSMLEALMSCVLEVVKDDTK